MIAASFRAPSATAWAVSRSACRAAAAPTWAYTASAPYTVERGAEHGGSFVVVQRGELPGGAGDEDPGDADVLQVPEQRFLALLVQVTVGFEGHGSGGKKGGWRDH